MKIFISDLAEQFLLSEGNWTNNPTNGEKNGIRELVAAKQWERETYAFAGGYVKALEEFNKVLYRYYAMAVTELNKGNNQYFDDFTFAEERIEFLKSLRINQDLDR